MSSPSFQNPRTLLRERIFDLHQRHAAAVCRVLTNPLHLCKCIAPRRFCRKIVYFGLVLAQREGESNYATPSRVTGQTIKTEPEIRIAIDAKRRRVVFERWGEINGVVADLLISLSEPFWAACMTKLHRSTTPSSRHPSS